MTGQFEQGIGKNFVENADLSDWREYTGPTGTAKPSHSSGDDRPKKTAQRRARVKSLNGTENLPQLVPGNFVMPSEYELLATG